MYVLSSSITQFCKVILSQKYVRSSVFQKSPNDFKHSTKESKTGSKIIAFVLIYLRDNLSRIFHVSTINLNTVSKAKQ